MRLLRLPGRKNCDRVRVKGTLWKGKHVNVRWLSGDPFHLAKKPATAALYVGVLSSTRLDKSAVKRNRMRRRCKEALRLLIEERSGQRPAASKAAPDSPLPATRYPLSAAHSLQLLLLPRSSSLSCTFSELHTDLSRFLSSVHL